MRAQRICPGCTRLRVACSYTKGSRLCKPCRMEAEMPPKQHDGLKARHAKCECGGTFLRKPFTNRKYCDGCTEDNRQAKRHAAAEKRKRARG